MRWWQEVLEILEAPARRALPETKSISVVTDVSQAEAELC